MPNKQVISASDAPKAIGPYSAGIRLGNLVFTAGQLGIDPANGELVPGGIEAQTRRSLENVKNVLREGGASMGDVVKTMVFLQDMNEFAEMNAVYSEFFPTDPPARSTVQVAALPKGGAVEIEALAVLP